MLEKEHTHFAVWKLNHAELWQFIKYAMIGTITSIIELGSFALLNFWVFTPFRGQEFSWWIIKYTAADGGLTAFLSYAVSYAVSQTFGFFAQRKTTFKANNNVKKSAAMYLALIIVLYSFQLYLPTQVRALLINVFSEALSDILTKLIVIFCTMLVQFPMSKWVIMKRR